MFILTEGVAKVFLKKDFDSEQTQVGQIGPGQFFGEMSLVLGEARNATVSAATDCKLYKIQKEAMSELFERDPALLEYIAGIIDTRKRQNRSLAEQSLKTEDEGKVSMILQRIQNFFSIGH